MILGKANEEKASGINENPEMSKWKGHADISKRDASENLEERGELFIKCRKTEIPCRFSGGWDQGVGEQQSGEGDAAKTGGHLGNLSTVGGEESKKVGQERNMDRLTGRGLLLTNSGGEKRVSDFVRMILLIPKKGRLIQNAIKKSRLSPKGTEGESTKQQKSQKKK